MSKQRLLLTAFAFLLSFAGYTVFTGCAVGPNYIRPEDPSVTGFQEAAISGVSLNEPIREWWKGFNDLLLEKLVAQALAANNEIAAAVARLKKARAFLRESRLGLFPTILGTADYEKSKLSNLRMPGIDQNNQELELYDAGFDAIWELDFFGRIRREIEARTALRDSAIASLEDVQQSIVSELVRDYIELRNLQKQLRITNNNIQLQENSYRLTMAKYEAGSVTELDVSQAATLLGRTRALAPAIEAQVMSRIYQIAALLGNTPGAVTEELRSSEAIPQYLSELSVGNPTALLRRRPDVRAAERNLAATVSRIGVAVADLFPRVELFGTLSVEAENFQNLTADPTSVYSFGPRITWQAFNISRVLSNITESRAEAEEQLALYQESVLSALKEVEIALVQFGKERERRAMLSAAVKSSKKAAELADIQYQNGLVDFVSVLNAQRDALEVELSFVNSDTTCVTALISVFKSLGAPVSYTLPR